MRLPGCRFCEPSAADWARRVCRGSSPATRNVILELTRLRRDSKTMAAVVRKSPSMGDLLQDSSSSLGALTAAALWALLQQVLRSVSIMVLEVLRLAQLIGVPLLTVAQARRSISPRRRRLSGGMMEPQEWLHQPDVWQLLRHDVKERPAGSVGSASSRTTSQRLTHPGRRFTVVLDLDETLVWTQRSEHYADSAACGRQVPAGPYHQGAFSVHAELSDGVWGSLTVVPRPGLAEFLRRVNSIADVVVFTASQPGYAKPILDVLDPTSSLFRARLYRDSTTELRHHSNVKDLSRLGCDLARTVLVDNSPFSFLMQPSNGLPVRPFSGQPRDNDLLMVVLPIVEGLSACGGDIRPVLDKEFRMRAWLQRRLPPQ